jgi:hypothetical protein
MDVGANETQIDRRPRLQMHDHIGAYGQLQTIPAVPARPRDLLRTKIHDAVVQRLDPERERSCRDIDPLNNNQRMAALGIGGIISYRGSDGHDRAAIPLREFSAAMMAPIRLFCSMSTRCPSMLSAFLETKSK